MSFFKIKQSEQSGHKEPSGPRQPDGTIVVWDESEEMVYRDYVEQQRVEMMRYRMLPRNSPERRKAEQQARENIQRIRREHPRTQLRGTVIVTLK